MTTRALALLLAFAVAPRLHAQGRTTPDAAALHVDGVTAILAGELALAFERGGDSVAVARSARAAATVARGYATVARSPALTNELLARAASTHLAGDPASASAATLRRTDEQLFRLLLLQAAQGARLVEQNDRIIALLEAQAARR